MSTPEQHHLPYVSYEDILAEDVNNTGIERIAERYWEDFKAKEPVLANEILKRAYVLTEDSPEQQKPMLRIASYMFAVLQRAAEREAQLQQANSESSAAGDGGEVLQP